MTGLPEKYRTGEPAGGEKGSRSPELGADGTGSPSAAARAAEFISQRGSLPSTSSSAPLLSHPRSDAHSRGGAAGARRGHARLRPTPGCCFACRSWTGIDERKGIGSARVEWNDQASGAGDRGAPGPLLSASPRVRRGHGPPSQFGGKSEPSRDENLFRVG
jgi:hypothetical protein